MAQCKIGQKRGREGKQESMKERAAVFEELRKAVYSESKRQRGEVKNGLKRNAREEEEGQCVKVKGLTIVEQRKRNVRWGRYKIKIYSKNKGNTSKNL